MIRNQEELEIKNMYFRDHISINTIHKRTGKHHMTIKRVLFSSKDDGDGQDRILTKSHYEKLFEENRSFIKYKLEEYPELKCTRLSQILAERNVHIPVHQLRIFIKKLRPSKPPKAYMKVKLFSGEQAQVDWASCGKLTVNGYDRKLSLFVMVLSYSRAIFARFYFSQAMDAVSSGHVNAFRYFGGIPRTILYDNMKTAVIERNGKAIRFNKDLVELATKYRFTPEACTPYCAWEKGRVEKLIRYIRDNFLVARRFRDIAEANNKIMDWLNNIANKRAWTEDRSRNVWDVWHEEKLKTLQNFIDDGYIPYHRKSAAVQKTPYIRFDLNNYSVPHQYVQSSVDILASDELIRIFSGNKEIASHRRSYGKGQDIENKDHIEALIKAKYSSHFGARKEHLFTLIPAAEIFFQKMSERGYHLPTSCRALHKLAKLYDLCVIDDVMEQLLEMDIAAMDALTHLLEKTKTDKTHNVAPPDLSRHPELNNIHIRSHSLNTYNQLTNPEPKGDDKK